MKLLRFFLLFLGLLLALSGLLVGLAFLPAMQTWAVQALLDERPGLHASVGSVAARFGHAEITDLQFEVGGVGITVPSVQVRLPLTTAGRKRQLLISGLVAKGWTVDLSRMSGPDEAPTQAGPAPAAGSPVGARAGAVKKAAGLMGAVLSGWTLPCDVSLDGIELEGDVLLAGPTDNAPVRVHLIVKGGGLAAGRPGTFTIEASATDPSTQVTAVHAQGRLVATMDTPRTLQRIELEADCSVQGGSFPEGFAWTADLAAARGPTEETYSLALARERRPVVQIVARASRETGRLQGNWKVDVRDADGAPLVAGRQLPAVAAAGEGVFGADADFAEVQVSGRVNAVANHLDVLAPALARVGEVTLATHFNLTRTAQTIRLDELGFSLAAERPVAVVHSLQPFQVDEKTGELRVADPQQDWIEASIQGLPLAWFPALRDSLTFAGGEATGGFMIRAADGKFALIPKAPLVATGVTVQRAGRPLGRPFDLSRAFQAETGPHGWQVQGAPLILSRAGRRVATLEAKVSRPAATDQPMAITGKWSADLAELVPLVAMPELAGITARTASGDVSATIGTTMAIEAKAVVIGHDPGHSLTTSFRVDRDADGILTLSAPFKLNVGANVSDLMAEATWADDDAGGRLNVKLTGENVDVEQLRLLAAPLAAAAGIGWPVRAAVVNPGPDRRPFWGDWVGNLTVAFEHVQAGAQAFDEVGGSFDLDHGSVRLERGRGGIPRHSPVQAEGVILFNAAAEFPYSLKATAAIKEVDAAALLGAVPPGEDPLIEGRFAITDTLTGRGNTLPDLIAHLREEFQLASSGGIIRLLRTSIGDSITEAPPSSVSETVGNVGTWVGSLFKVKEGSIGSSEKSVSPTTDAVLTLTSLIGETGYDRITVTAVRDQDRSFRLMDISIITPEESLTGTGQITGNPDQALNTRPLSLDLKLGFRGKPAALLVTAGLLSPQKDPQAFALLAPPLHFGGSLGQIDVRAWHDLLVKAAAPKPGDGKK